MAILEDVFSFFSDLIRFVGVISVVISLVGLAVLCIVVYLWGSRKRSPS